MESIVCTAPEPDDFPLENRTAPLSKLAAERPKDSRFCSYLPIENPGDFPPENRTAPLPKLAAERPKDSRFCSYLPIENPSKRPGAVVALEEN